MKKRIILPIVIVFLLHITTLLACAFDADISVGYATGTAGETVDITVDLSGCEGFANIWLEIDYDETILELVGVENGVTGVTFTDSETLDALPYNLSWTGTKNIVFTGTLATLKFKISEDAPDGIYPVTVDYYKGIDGKNVDGYHVNFDEDFEALNMSYSNGMVLVENGSGEVVEPDGAFVRTGNAAAKAGDIVEIPLELKNCDGFTNISLEIFYDKSAMSLVEVVNGDSGIVLTESEFYTANPYVLIWNGTGDTTFNGTLATLKFEISETAALGEYPVTVDYYKGIEGLNVDGYHVNFNEEFEALGLEYVYGKVAVKPEEHIIQVEKTEDEEGVRLNIRAFAPDENEGELYIALYNGNKLAESYIRDASESHNIEFTEAGGKIKVMWLKQLLPLCECVELTLGEEL